MRQLLVLAAVIVLAAACGDAFTAGEGGGAGGSGGSTGPCDSAADCGDPGWCAQATCEDHRCGTVPRSAGTELPDSQQTLGDCQIVVCDGSGSVISEDDPDDLPDDDNPCTDDLCVNGAPENVPVAAGVSCGEDNMQCDGAGTCVGCTQASQCGEDNECQTPTCSVHGECGMQYVPDGTQVGPDDPGDCQVNVCDGDGNVESIADDADEPISPNDCFDEFCENGVVKTNPIADDSPCDDNANGRICCGGVCCDVGAFCNSGTCASNG